MAQRQLRISAYLVEIVVVAILFLGLAGIAFWQFSTSFEAQGANSGSPFDNAAMFPRLIAWGLVLLSLFQIARLLISWQHGDKGQDRQTGDLVRPEPNDECPQSLTVRAIAAALVFVVYLFALTPVGYVTTTPMLVAAIAIILGARWWMAGLIGLAATLAVGFVFGTLLNVVLPVGRLGLPTIF